MPNPPLFLADHPVLDFLNTLVFVEGTPNGELTDMLQSDADVVAWLVQAKLDWHATAPHPGLLEAARTLRSALRQLIESRQQGTLADPDNLSEMNYLLAGSPRTEQLVPQPSGTYVTETYWPEETPEQILAPLVYAAAKFLQEPDFSPVRRCEGPNCVLWFYDRTKSHHRRWCSMATCGNRHKVARYRERQTS